jgi:hypothetical protein
MNDAPSVLADRVYELASLTSLYLLYVWLRAICWRDCLPVPRQEKHVPDLLGLPFTTSPHE